MLKYPVFDIRQDVIPTKHLVQLWERILEHVEGCFDVGDQDSVSAVDARNFLKKNSGDDLVSIATLVVVQHE